mgnify:CR=1 FL=1
MSCEGENIGKMSMFDLQRHQQEHWLKYLHAKQNTTGEPRPVSEARAIIELKQSRLLFAQIVFFKPGMDNNLPPKTDKSPDI